MRAQVDALNVKRPVKGATASQSLLDLGFNRLGIDDGWQACGTGSMVQPGGTFHDDAGKPLVNKTKFPSLKALTEYATSKGVDLGFYWNNVSDACSVWPFIQPFIGLWLSANSASATNLQATFIIIHGST
jgi:hypothetical protein